MQGQDVAGLLVLLKEHMHLQRLGLDTAVLSVVPGPRCLHDSKWHSCEALGLPVAPRLPHLQFLVRVETGILALALVESLEFDLAQQKLVHSGTRQDHRPGRRRKILSAFRLPCRNSKR